ncbi:MAG: DUF2065 domain-containing protein [Gammaproteobacteria bacterium]|nr:DUF2065 domain-containing protein [Gammaproteobacteria bacterium]
MWDSLVAAIALLLIIEGILPFLSPAGLRRTLTRMAEMDDRALRTGGLVSMLLGLGLLYFVRY